MLVIALLVQAAAPPDIEIDIRATVREASIEQSGETSLEVRAEPDAGSAVRVDVPRAERQRRLRNLVVRIHGEARIGDPLAGPAADDPNSPNPEPPETQSPQ